MPFQGEGTGVGELTWGQQGIWKTIQLTGRTMNLGGAMAMPAAPDSYEELVRGLSAVVDRDVRRHHIERIVARAGVSLDAPAAWLLMRLDERSGATPDTLAHRAPYDAHTIQRAADELRAAGFVVDGTEIGAGALALTDAGCKALERIVAARRAHLAEVFGEWSEEERGDFTALLRRLAPQLVPDARSSTSASD